MWLISKENGGERSSWLYTPGWLILLRNQAHRRRDTTNILNTIYYKDTKWVDPRNPDPALKWRPPTKFKMKIVLSQRRENPHRGFLAAYLPPKRSNLSQNKTNVDWSPKAFSYSKWALLIWLAPARESTFWAPNAKYPWRLFQVWPTISTSSWLAHQIVTESKVCVPNA